MFLRPLLLLFASLFVRESLQAQDFHFTQYNMAPLALNPAQTGNFEGTARIGGIYRSQWHSVVGSSSRYSTPSVYVDAPIIRGFRSRDWVGVGVGLITDKSGTIAMKRTAFTLGATYHLGLDKKGNTVLAIGGQYGNESRGISRDNALLEDHQLAGQPIQSSMDFGNLRTDKASFTDIHAGIGLTSRLNKRMDLNVGFAMFHIGEPSANLVQQGVSKLPRRSVLHGQFNMGLTDRFTFSPSFLFQTASGADEIALQGLAGYLFNPEKGITVNFGLGYRLRDAIEILAGAEYKNLRVGVSYDINTSDLNPASNYRGGFEIAANYIIKIYKPAAIKPKVLCPRF